MVRTKVTVRRLPGKMRKLPAWMVNREYGTNKNKQVLKTINVRQKSKYFSGKNCLIF